MVKKLEWSTSQVDKINYDYLFTSGRNIILLYRILFFSLNKKEHFPSC